MPVMAIHERKTRRWTRAEYDRLIDLGVFQPGDPIELIGGELLVAEPQGAPHYTSIRRTARVLERAFGPSWEVRTQGPIGLDEESEPEPDVAVVPGAPEDYGSAHPSRADLVVEVSESSLAFDRGHKGSVYARASILDYWIVNLADRVLEVYREPAPDAAAPFGASYARREILDSSRQVSPLATPHAKIHVRDLFV
jgi:Uma2 family endonuclease